MINRRSDPLYWILALGALVLLARLWQVQVHEHPVWATEAARLVHSGREIPYRRGRILDAEGRVLARDKDTHHLVLVYRDFRREHPLGVVAHARSLLVGRPVSIQEAHENLIPWAAELVQLTPADVSDFGNGLPLETATLALPELVDGAAENRRWRASDLRFYVKRLLPLSPRQSNAVARAGRRKEGREKTYLQLATEVLGKGDPQKLARGVERRLIRSVEQLERLARRMEWAQEQDELPVAPLERLLALLEDSRRWVEDATASKLFAEATSFPVGRLDPELAFAAIDHGWIRRLLCWDDDRTRDWLASSREGWAENWRDDYALPRLILPLFLEPALEPGPDELLARAAAIYQPEGALDESLNGALADWRAIDELAVFPMLGEIFEGRSPSDWSPAETVALPVQSPALRSAYAPGSALSGLLDRVWNDPGPDVPSGAVIDAHLRADDEEEVIDYARALVRDWDEYFQLRVAEVLERLVNESAAEDLSLDGRLVLAEELRDRAVERAEYLLKDYGTRPIKLVRGEPRYDVIYLLTRYSEDLPGFEVREARERDYPILPGDSERMAPWIVGSVSTVQLRELLSQRAEAQLLRQLKRNPDRSEAEAEELKRLVGQVRLHDEVKGVSGVEGYWNQELIGRNGYRESRGLEDVYGGGREEDLMRPAEDGQDVTLTLDADLQRVARSTLQYPPAPPPHEDAFDWDWHANPVGAIVFASIDGDVLAAASEPNPASRIGDFASSQRQSIIERTMRIPTFQPPGSVFKPFVAAYALEEAGLDPSAIVTCGPLETRSGSGYKDVRCWKRGGHGEVDLEQALVGSCNAYFAHLGETLEDADLRRAADLFGFGAATGVRTPPPWDEGLLRRGGFIEEAGGITSPELLMRLQGDWRLGEFQRRLLGNGLGEIQATPMQLTAAILSLALGKDCDLRIVKRIGNEDLPLAERRRLGVSDSTLERVRTALVKVTTSPLGTAHRALAPELLGFPVAVKTGSADITGRADDLDDHRVRKHTWVAGWVPAEDPVAVFVVFVHNTQTTSSHGAVYLARALLQEPFVLNWLAARGVDLAQVPGR